MIPYLSIKNILGPRIFDLGRKGVYAVLDQGLYAGANFLGNILLARWLVPGQFGAYSTAYAIFWLVSGFHSAVIIESMMIFGSGNYIQGLRDYFNLLIRGHWLMTGMISLVLAIVSLAFISTAGDLAQALLGLAASSPFILLLWVVRRVFYIIRKPNLAALGGPPYMVMTVVGIYGLYHAGKLSPFSAFIVMGISSLLSCFVLLLYMRKELNYEKIDLPAAHILKDHWIYGRWSTATAMLVWFPTNIYYALLPATSSFTNSAALSALTNLITPILQANTALASSLIPEYVHTYQSKGKQALTRLVYASLGAFAIGAFLYWLALIVLRVDALSLLYGQNYREYANILVLMGLLPFFSVSIGVLGSALRSIERPDKIFWCYAFSTIASLTIGVAMSSYYGLTGSILGQILANAVTAIAMAFFYFTGNEKMKGKNL